MPRNPCRRSLQHGFLASLEPESHAAGAFGMDRRPVGHVTPQVSDRSDAKSARVMGQGQRSPQPHSNQITGSPALTGPGSRLRMTVPAGASRTTTMTVGS